MRIIKICVKYILSRKINGVSWKKRYPIFLLFWFLQQSEAVQNCKDCNTDIAKYRDPHIWYAEGAEKENCSLNSQSTVQVFVNYAEGAIDHSKEAILGKDFGEFASKVQPGDSLDTIGITSYAPNRLKYRYSVKSDRAAIFSEIYYPNGWTATVDGTPVDIFRANWTLRGIILPAGEHELEMSFDPKSYKISSNISRASSAGLIILLILSIAGIYFPAKKKEKEGE